MIPVLAAAARSTSNAAAGNNIDLWQDNNIDLWQDNNIGTESSETVDSVPFMYDMLSN